jgi:hypothetical protein
MPYGVAMACRFRSMSGSTGDVCLQRVRMYNTSCVCMRVLSARILFSKHQGFQRTHCSGLKQQAACSIVYSPSKSRMHLHLMASSRDSTVTNHELHMAVPGQHIPYAVPV